MVFRALGGQLYMVLHRPNRISEVRPCFYKTAEVNGRLRLAVKNAANSETYQNSPHRLH